MQVSGRNPTHGDITPGHSGRIGPGTGNDSVTDDLMLCGMQLVHPVDHDGG